HEYVRLPRRRRRPAPRRRSRRPLRRADPQPRYPRPRRAGRSAAWRGHADRRGRHHVRRRCGRKIPRRRGAGSALHRAHLPRARPDRRMRMGIPREIKDGEFRVALTPRGVAALRNVVVEPGAGLGVGFTDADYVAAGATLGDAWACDLVVKVKELQAPEYGKPRRGQTVFGFQHFAPEPELLEAALARGATFIAYET